MKFLCDRCKTRYSIGDERVRGKILKIRCKNCANVITVREGMPDADAPGAPRRTTTTIAAPLVEAVATVAAAPVNGAGARKPANALGAAFASAMTKPPPALDEEWYVSIDGEQSGPFSLAEAQRWVAGKTHDADLHCWSEGFDDWLPVDKVSHFRGLRKKPHAPMMPPPVPRSGPGRAATAGAPRSIQAASIAVPEEEPKPLFAATMASLEKAANAPAMAAAMGVSNGAAAVRVEARSNGISARAPLASVIPTTLPAAKSVPTVRGVAVPAVIKPVSAFEADASSTVAEAAPFQDEQATAAEPVAATARRLISEPRTLRGGPDADDNGAANKHAFANALATVKDGAKKPAVSLSALAGKPAKPTLSSLMDAPTLSGSSEPAPEPDDLDIGEVSRVVNLADIIRQAKAGSPASGKRTGAVPKLNGALPVTERKLNATVPLSLIDAVDAPPDAATDPAPLEEVPAVAASHRRGMIALLLGALFLVGAAVVVVVFVVNNRNDATGLGGDYEYNGQRPDDPIRRPGDPPNGSAAEPPPNPFIPRPPRPPRPPQNPGSAKIDPPLGNSLRSDEIEAMAHTSESTTVACFRRADKGADAIRLADVKKIRVTFHIAPDGTVSNVDLSEKSSATLVSCLQRMIGSWKFRANAGGDFGFVFAKPQ